MAKKKLIDPERLEEHISAARKAAGKARAPIILYDEGSAITDEDMARAAKAKGKIAYTTITAPFPVLDPVEYRRLFYGRHHEPQPVQPMNVLLLAHRHPVFGNPRGGERSMRIIAEWLASKGANVRVLATGWEDQDCTIKGVQYVHYRLFPMSRSEQIRPWLHMHAAWSDVCLAWATSVKHAYFIKQEMGVPYVHFVRWWRNVAPIHPSVGSIEEKWREKDEALLTHIDAHKHLFDEADKVVCNCAWATALVGNVYNCGGKASTSYVPMEPGRYELFLESADTRVRKRPHKRPALTLVSPDRGFGEYDFARALVPTLGRERLLVVNAEKEEWLELQREYPDRVTVMGYQRDMDRVWRETDILLLPVYRNDLCGTTRVVIEAAMEGIPVIATGRGGVGELCVSTMIKDGDTPDMAMWGKAMSDTLHGYKKYSELQITRAQAVRNNQRLRYLEGLIHAASTNRVGRHGRSGYRISW